MRLAIGVSVLALCAAVPLIAQPSSSPGAAEAIREAREPFDPAKARAVVEKLATALEENFVFPDTGKAYAAALRTKLAAGGYRDFPDGQAFADAVTADLQAVHKDGHLALHVVPAEDRRPDPQGQGGPAMRSESGIARSGWLADGIAYIDFRVFPGNETTLAELRRFIAAHRDARALIIDARAHRGGGLAEMDLLFPELFTRATPLVMMDTREAVVRARGAPVEAGSSLRTVKAPPSVVRLEHFVTPAARQGGLAKAKVYLLVSGRTASAAEHLALSLKRTHRATLVGETTRGAGHYGGMLPMDDSMTYAAFIPVGRTFDPDTGEGWEGVGVKPDVAVPADQALDRALQLAGAGTDAKTALAQLR